MSLREQLRKPTLDSEDYFYVDSSNLSENINFIQNEHIENIYLIPRKGGYKLEEIDFLADLPFVKSIRMTACDKVKNFNGIKNLEQLEDLHFFSAKNITVDLSNLKNLKRISIFIQP
ncbi:MAG: hypothetical protein NE328_10370 [Lentisphaeraceae bacterium]|nr:hypothetical protein [Lentisphaeraceae bacterium]